MTAVNIDHFHNLLYISSVNSIGLVNKIQRTAESKWKHYADWCCIECSFMINANNSCPTLQRTAGIADLIRLSRCQRWQCFPSISMKSMVFNIIQNGRIAFLTPKTLISNDQVCDDLLGWTGHSGLKKSN